MKKGKRGQASLIVVILLLILIMVLVVIAVVVLVLRPDIIGFNQPKEAPVIIRTIQETSNKPLCNYPYTQVGNSCCLDKNFNGICDSDEIQKENIKYCSRPYIKDGTACCLDIDDNRICDQEEYRRYRNERASIDDPFDITDVDVYRDELTLEIKNIGDETVTIKSIDVEDCNDINRDITLEEDEKETFDFDCDFPSYIDSDIELRYVIGNSTDIKTADGKIRDDSRYYDDIYYINDGY